MPADIPALDKVFESVYDELRRVAHNQLRAEAAGHTLNTTALVNETYLKLSLQRADIAADRDKFFAMAATSMRRILVDYARRHRALKRPRGGAAVSLSALDGNETGAHPLATEVDECADTLLALDAALHDLSAIDARLVQVVEHRFFCGRTEPETAAILGVTTRTVARDWARARAWLASRLQMTGDLT
jgi:RNA polymerase sigma factor (TIGR02999 family)